MDNKLDLFMTLNVFTNESGDIDFKTQEFGFNMNANDVKELPMVRIATIDGAQGDQVELIATFQNAHVAHSVLYAEYRFEISTYYPRDIC